MTNFEIRAAVPDDMQGVAALRRRVFNRSRLTSEVDMGGYYRDVFFDGPFADVGLPSLIASDRNGIVVGFMGRLRRSFRLADRELVAAVATELMVDAEWRSSLIAPRLVRSFLQGPQDFTVSDRVNETARRCFVSCGGEVSLWHSSYWSVPLKPLRSALYRIGGSRIPRVAGWVVAPLDSLARRVFPDLAKLREPHGTVEPLLAERIAAEGALLRIRGIESKVDDAFELTWVLRRLEERATATSARVVSRLVLTANREVAGWFIALMQGRERCDVVALRARTDTVALVFDHVVHAAFSAGVGSVNGRWDSGLTPLIVERRIESTLAQPWVVFHTRSDAIRSAFVRGQVSLSRLDAEWWLSP